MTDTSHHPKIPWWVSWWADDPTTTPSSLRQQAWLFFVMAAVFVSISAVRVFARPSWWTGEIVLPVSAGLFPLAFTGGGVWILLASRWIDRHQAWDRISTPEDREAYAANSSLWRRSLPLGMLLLVIGAVVGALVGWIWENEVGIPAGFACGALGGFVLGTSLAGYREGVRSGGGNSADVESQGAEPSAAAGGGRNVGS